MKWVAVSVLALVGLLEFALRLLFVLLLVVSVIGFFLLLVVFDDSDDVQDLIKPFCFGFIEDIVDNERESRDEILKLQQDLFEARQMLLIER